VSPTYKELLKHIDDFVNEQPPSGAIAGLYALSDSARGVWVAPANRSVLATKGPTRVVSHTQQEALNIDSVSGKSINAIRSFPGKGTLVWGARTLDGNSSEWKYVPVRRLLSMLSASIESGLDWAVFEPNDANTWSRVERSVSNFLNDLWRQGAFAGAKASEAYYVKVGLNSTMTENDIDNNILRVEIGVAPLRPAEFIILQIQQFFKRE
jgi:phage tail sheath protein FI